MLQNICKAFKNDNAVITKTLIRGLKMRGKPPSVARTLKQRLEEINFQDPEISFKVNIGFALPVKSRVEEFAKRDKDLKTLKEDQNLERASRKLELKIPLEEVRSDWCSTSAPFHLKAVAEHYSIFNDLFGDAYFYPQVMLDVTYNSSDGNLVPVYRGNVVKPVSATTSPNVSYKSKDNHYWTLILTNPDGHFTMENKEYIHWMIGNIPGNNIDKGEVIWDYLQPFPARGTGFQRFIFILFRQQKKLDYSTLKKSHPCLELEDRTFNTKDFYRQRQDDLTPAGLAFFQSDWDKSLTNFYHNVLNMREPVFEYDHDSPPIKKQQYFPKKRAFNVYLDRYRDPKQIGREVLLRKLKKVEPLKKPEPQFPYPSTLPYKRPEFHPSWLRHEKNKARGGHGIEVLYQDED